jgi:hypothetical protein
MKWHAGQWPLGMLATAVLVTSVTAIRLSAEEPKPDADGWISLFNGKDLSGWKKNEDGQFEVVDGTLKVSGKRAHLFTEKEFKNFEFKAECKTTKGSNSGLYFHTKYQESGWPEQGYEVQVNVSHTDNRRTGSLYSVKDVSEVEVKDDEWYETYIKVVGRHIIVKINGKTTVDWVQPEDYKHPQFSGRKIGSGSFAIQAHDPKSVVYYRNIRVRPLPD